MQSSNSSVVNLIYRRTQNHSDETNICGFFENVNTVLVFHFFKEENLEGFRHLEEDTGVF